MSLTREQLDAIASDAGDGYPQFHRTNCISVDSYRPEPCDCDGPKTVLAIIDEVQNAREALHMVTCHGDHGCKVTGCSNKGVGIDSTDDVWWLACAEHLGDGVRFD